MVDFEPSLLRMRNMFPAPTPSYGGQDSPLNMPEPFTGPNPIEESNPVDETNTRLNKGMEAPESKFKTPRPVEEAFMKFLDQFPERERPGKMGHLAGVLEAFTPNATPETVDKTMNRGYYRKLDDWKTKAGVMSTAANLERNTIRDQETDEYRDFLNQTRRDDLERKKTEGTTRLGIQQQNADTATKRAQNQTDALDNGHIVTDRQGNMKLIITKGPKRGQVTDLGVDDLTFADKLKLQQEGRLTIVNDQQEAAQELARLKHKYEEEEITRRAEEQRTTNAAKTGDKELKPNEIKQLKLNRIAAYVRRHPEQEGWIQTDEASNVITMRPPTVRPWTSTENAAKYAKAISDFNSYVDEGKDEPATGAIPGNNTGTIKPDSKFSKPPVAPANNGKVSIIMLAPDGKTRGTVSSEAEARRLEGLKPPYTRAK